MTDQLSARVCIIGAGPSGITAAKNCLQVGLKNIVIYEKGEQVGGNWIYSPQPGHSSVFETTHIISSKGLSQYEDYPMPEDYPDYPSHQQVLAYFQAYARHFGVTDYIQFKTEVTRAEKIAGERWRITLGDGRQEEFDYLMVANGHHWDPRMPQYPGQFSGQFIHSHDYKSAAPFAGQRVLVIGGGNSACDIAVETSRVSAFSAISWRRGYYIVPKFMLGRPADAVNARFLWIPARLRAVVLRWALRLTVGPNTLYGLQEPEHSLYQVHPVSNSELLYFIRHGKVHPRPDIKRLEGSLVEFTDGRREAYDTIIAATGFYISFPFFDPQFLNFRDREVPLYKRVFHPNHPSLMFIGLIQPMGCIWPLSDAQAKLAANYIAGHYQLPADLAARTAAEVAEMKRQYIDTPRHSVEVHYHDHLGELKRELPKGAPAWG
jgi:cation diffusion facilitator CzcD-associated flavoprotein CzcO